MSSLRQAHDRMDANRGTYYVARMDCWPAGKWVVVASPVGYDWAAKVGSNKRLAERRVTYNRQEVKNTDNLVELRRMVDMMRGAMVVQGGRLMGRRFT